MPCLTFVVNYSMESTPQLTEYQRQVMDRDNALSPWPMSVDQWLTYRQQLGSPVPATDPRLH